MDARKRRPGVTESVALPTASSTAFSTAAGPGAAASASSAARSGPRPARSAASSAGAAAGWLSRRRARRSARRCPSSASSAGPSGSACGGQGGAGEQQGALRQAQLGHRRPALPLEPVEQGPQLAGGDQRRPQVDAGRVPRPGLRLRAAAVVRPVLDQHQPFRAQERQVLLHGALVAARRARDRGVGGGEHRRAAQAPAAVEAQQRAQGADRAGAEAELAAALLERAAGRARVRQGGGEASGRRRRARARRPRRRSAAPRRGGRAAGRGARPRGPRRCRGVACSRSRPEGVLLQEGDARREPPIVLARRAGTPYRNGHAVCGSVAHPLEPAVGNGRLVAFQGGCAERWR